MMLKHYIGTLGIDIKEISSDLYTLKDSFSNCSIPFESKTFCELQKEVLSLCNAEILGEKSSLLDTYLTMFKWYELEEIYAVEISNKFRIWQYEGDFHDYDRQSLFMPIIYTDYGYGLGSKLELQKFHEFILGVDELPFNKEILMLKLAHLTVDRICSDILSLLHRSIDALLKILLLLRQCVSFSAFRLHNELFDPKEISYTGKISQEISSAATIAIISLCTSLDLSAKLMNFINKCEKPVNRLIPIPGKTFSDRNNMKAKAIDSEVIENFNVIWNNSKSASFILQARHDLIHNTTALELERIFIGFGTEQINEFPLYYAYLPSRDCNENGQPVRYLGRSFFIDQNHSFEKILMDWILDIIDGHVAIGENLLNFISKI
jgi:hypothetical protein